MKNSKTLTNVTERDASRVGSSDEEGYHVASRVLTMGDLYATIYKALAIAWRKEYMSPIGRPVKIANSLEDRTGEPVDELLG